MRDKAGVEGKGRAEIDMVNWMIMCELHYEPCSLPKLEPEKGMSKFSRDMLSLLEDPKDADVKFLFEDEGRVEEIKAHKHLLVARSTYFRSLFDSGMRECVDKEIRIEESPALFKEVLKFIYTGQPPERLGEIPSCSSCQLDYRDHSTLSMELLPLADKYGLDELKALCVLALQRHVCADNVIEILLLAETLHLPALLRYCIPCFQEYVDQLKSDPDWTKLRQNPDLLMKIIEYSFDISLQ